MPFSLRGPAGPIQVPTTFALGNRDRCARTWSGHQTLASVSSARTRVEPAFEPGLVRQLKSAAEHDMRVGGADLAGQAIKAGLADEVRLFLVPVVVGGG
jgi:dihydrofolate reductase